MKTELVDVNPTRKSLNIELPPEVVAAEIEKTTAQYRRTAKIPGFRPGKVPARVIQQRFRSQIMAEVAQDLVQKAITDAIAEQNVEPVASPAVRNLVLEEGRPMTFSADIDVLPSFDPGPFETLHARRSPVQVDDAAVDESLDQLRQRAARFEPVEGAPAELGHTLLVDLERQSTDKTGRRGELHKQPGTSIELGDGGNPPGFDDQLHGLTSGGRKTFTLRTPDDAPDEDARGTETTYSVHVHDIRRRVVPELDDEFAKDLGEFDTVEALRGRVRADLEQEARTAAERQTRAEVLKALATRVPFDIPPALIDREVERRLSEFVERLAAQRVDPRQVKIDWNAFRQGQRDPAADAVKSGLVLDEIAKREDLGVSEVEIDAEVERIARGMGAPVHLLRERLEEEGGYERIAHTLRREKALKHAMSRATIVDA